MGLYEKMYKVMEESEGIEKNMSVGFGSNSYKAVSEASVLNAVKPLLKKHRLILFPVEQEVIDRYDTFTTQKGESSRLMTQIKSKYKIVDIDTGESEILETVGNGVDTQDKASGKALTYGYKALLQKTFMLFSGEDTDNEHSDAITDRNAYSKKEAPKQEWKESLNIPEEWKDKVIEPELISEAQAKRLYAISKGKTDQAKAIMLKYGFGSSKAITKDVYGKICEEVEKINAEQ